MRGVGWGGDREERSKGRKKTGVGWVAVGAASVVAMRKQSNTNSSHSRGTAGAHRDGCLGGLREGGELAGEISKNERQRVWVRIEMLKIEAIKERQDRERKNDRGEAATCEFSLYPRNYGKSIHINI